MYKRPRPTPIGGFYSMEITHVIELVDKQVNGFWALRRQASSDENVHGMENALLTQKK